MRTSDTETLIREAEKASQGACASYSKFKVGASVLTKSGKLYTAFNIENPSLMLTMCAERIALYKAITEEDSEIVAIAVASNSGKYCFPCGACRQAIYEFAPKADIFIKSKSGIRKYRIEELLPNAFRK